MHLNEYQLLAAQTDQQPEAGDAGMEHRSFLVPLLGLAGEVGELLGEHKKWLRDGDSYSLLPERVREELGDLLWYLSQCCHQAWAHFRRGGQPQPGQDSEALERLS